MKIKKIEFYKIRTSKDNYNYYFILNDDNGYIEGSIVLNNKYIQEKQLKYIDYIEIDNTTIYEKEINIEELENLIEKNIEELLKAKLLI